MRKATLAACVLALSGILFSVVPVKASLVPSANRPKIALHVQSPVTKNKCTGNGTLTTCSALVAKAASGGAGAPLYYFVYITSVLGDSMMTGGEGIAGLQCGIRFQNNEAGGNADGAATDVFGWNLCATLEFSYGGWPSSGGSNLITWDASSSDALKGCQKDELGVAGYFYVGSYGDDKFALIKRPVDGVAKVASCEAVEVVIEEWELGFVQFSSGAATAGCNPCLEYCAPIPVVPTTWGAVKSLYNR